MTHADHFLSRLDRVSLPHIEIALSLYRDDNLLRYILASVKIPDSAERVAIALADSQDGPFIVVTRNGKFVTCLGEGMSTGNLPIVSRGQLDGITNRVEVYRNRVAARKKLLGPGGEAAELIRSVYNRGNDLSREEFTAIASWQPILARTFFDFMAECGELTARARIALAPNFKRTDKLRPEWNKQLHQFWKMLFATGHFAVLATMDGKSPYEGLVLPKISRPVDSVISAFTMQDGIMAVYLKGIFAIAKLGKPLLPYYKEQYTNTNDKMHLRQSTMCLVGIAARHSKLRAEVKKALLPGPSRKSPALTKYGHVFAEQAVACLDDLDRSTCAAALIGAILICEMTKKLPENSPYRFVDPTNVPNDLATAIALTLALDTTNNVSHLTEMLMFVPVAARAAPEDLYLPKDFIDLYRKPWEPKDSLDLLASYVEEVRAPVRKSSEPTRSGPCPCGSGKKYKRCCAE